MAKSKKKSKKQNSSGKKKSAQVEIVKERNWMEGARGSQIINVDYYKKGQRPFKTVDELLNSNKPKHVGLLDYYMRNFYRYARGHVTNKYHVAFYGPYVDQALMVMDQNSGADKYHPNTSDKPFYDTGDNFRKSLFNDWLDMCYDRETGMLQMLWAAKSVTIPEPKADVGDCMIDSTKQMTFPVIKGIQCNNQLTINVVDDPYMMWYNFFNALFNVQFSPLLLKPKSTLQKINVMVTMYSEGLTYANSQEKPEVRSTDPCMTDLVNGQMFEFNSCITTASPAVNLTYDQATPFTFNVNLRYPNSFQGSFKDAFRYLRDNTTKGVSPVHLPPGVTCDAAPMQRSVYSPYGEYNKGFYEVDIGTWKERFRTSTYDAFQPEMYKKYIKGHQDASFKKVEYHYGYVVP